MIVADSVIVELENEMPIVDWLNTERKIEKLVGYNNFGYNFFHSHEEQAKIIGGPLLNEIVENMKDYSKRQSSHHHVLYSGHSTLLGGMLGSLGALNGLEPPYSSALIFELHKNQVKFLR